MAKLELQIGDKTYDKAWIDDLTSTSQISTDPASINYGVIPSTGSAKLRDLGGAIRADIEAGVLPASNARTKIRINGNQIQEHTTSDSDYDVINRELNLDFSDRLSLLDKVTYGGMPLRDYSMTAYEMLDDVLGSYGGYVKEMPRNWSIFCHPATFTIPRANTTRIEVDTISGYEIIGTVVKVKANKKHTIDCSIRVGREYTALDGTNGIAVQVLNTEPTDSDCKSISLAMAYLTTTVSTNILSLEFTPKTDSVYFVINFGYAADSQTVIADINSVKLDGYSIKDSLGSEYSRVPYVSGSTIAAGATSLLTRLNAIQISYPYIESSTYREALEKFCTLAQMTLSLNGDGKIVFKSARPQIFSSNDRTNSKIIDAKYKIANFNKTLFLKNKFDGVDIKQDKVVKTVNSDATIVSKEYGEEVNDIIVDDYTVDYGSTGSTRPAGICYVEDIKTESTSGTTITDYASCCGLSAKWIKLSEYIDVKQNNGLKTINNIVENANCTIKFLKKTTPCAMKTNLGSDATKVSDITYGETAEEIVTESGFLKVIVPRKNDIYSAQVAISDKTKQLAYEVYDADPDYSHFGMLVSAGYYFVQLELQAYSKTFYAFGSKTFVSATRPDVILTGEIVEYIPQHVSLSLAGSTTELSFEENDLSTAGIENANNAVSISTNELMQNESDVIEIRDSIMSDYANGVQTGTQELFCGIGDWEHGEIMQPYDTVQIEGEDGYWRVTGRTFKYAGSPTLSLELQKLHEKEWHDIDIGSGISTGTISTGSFTENGEKTGSIQLPSGYDYSGDSAYVVSVIFNINGDDYTETRASMGTASLSRYNSLGIHTVHCTITADWANGVLSYVAEEKYNKRVGVERKSYVKTITVTRLAQFY